MKHFFVAATLLFSGAAFAQQVNNTDSLQQVADSIRARQIADSLAKIAAHDARELKLLNDSIAKSEFSISYDVNIEAEAKNTIAETYNGAIKTLYVKGKKAKLKFVSLMRVQTVYFRYKSVNKNNVATVVKESGKEKYKFALSDERWKLFNKRFDSLRFELKVEDSTYILKRLCRKAIMTISPESNLIVYYLPGVKHEVLAAAEPLFASLPGVPLKYIFQKGNNKITYLATEINFLPIAESYFKEPNAGYQVKKFKPGAKIEKLSLTGEEGDDDGPEDEK